MAYQLLQKTSLFDRLLLKPKDVDSVDGVVKVNSVDNVISANFRNSERR